jgi:mono/diheme cytochrome c family protein
VKRFAVLMPTAWLAVGLLSLAIPAMALAGGNAAEGKKTYDQLCGVCHGVTGAGDGPAGSAIDPPPRNFNLGEFKFDANKDGVAGTDEDLSIVIKKGGVSFGGNPVMVPWSSLSDAEISNVIAYIRTLETTRTTPH